jgi:isopropylmalate/homocitrate/citramalate synthase
VEESVAAAERIVERAHADRIRATVTIGVSFGCPFEGAVDPGYVLDLASRLAAAQADEIVFADTVGVGVPRQARQLVSGALGSGVPIGVHLHNTRNTGFANAVAALEAGATVLDASVGGIGGCPFAPRATGNICTEDLVYLLDGEGVETGIDLDALIEIAAWLEELLGRQLPGQVYRAGPFVPVAG